MATIVVSRPHRLGLEQARAAVESVAGRLQADLHARYSWHGDHLQFECPGAKGCIEVGAQQVRVVVDIGLLLRPMRGRIEQSISGYLQDSLG